MTTPKDEHAHVTGPRVEGTVINIEVLDAEYRQYFSGPQPLDVATMHSLMFLQTIRELQRVRTLLEAQCPSS